MTLLQRGMTIEANGLTKPTIADCLQTRPIDHRSRMLRVRGRLESQSLDRINQALRIVFALD